MRRPSWARFSRQPFTAEVHAVIRALAIEVPRYGRPWLFHARSMLAISRQDGPDGARFRLWDGSPRGHRWLVTHYDVITAAALPEGTPDGDALRQWLQWWRD